MNKVIKKAHSLVNEKQLAKLIKINVFSLFFVAFLWVLFEHGLTRETAKQKIELNTPSSDVMEYSERISQKNQVVVLKKPNLNDQTSSGNGGFVTNNQNQVIGYVSSLTHNTVIAINKALLVLLLFSVLFSLCLRSYLRGNNPNTPCFLLLGISFGVSVCCHLHIQVLSTLTTFPLPQLNDPVWQIIGLSLFLLIYLFWGEPLISGTLQRVYRSKRENNTERRTGLMIYASQSGTAYSLAKQLISQTRFGFDLRCISSMHPDELKQYQTVLAVASTTGDGDAPDSAYSFMRQLSTTQRPNTTHHQFSFSVLGLGDRSYEQFCAFGKSLNQALELFGGKPLTPLATVNRLDKLDIQNWQSQLSEIFQEVQKTDKEHGSTELGEVVCATVIENCCFNEPSGSRPAHKIRIQHPELHFRPGDLLEIFPEIKAHHLDDRFTDKSARVYSIASQTDPHYLDIFVRHLIKDDGQSGLVSGMLARCQSGHSLNVRIRPHPTFRLPQSDNQRLDNTDIIMIGAGTGIAPFIGFLQTRLHQKCPARNWLLMGERCPEKDNYFDKQLNQLSDSKILTRRQHAWSKPTSDSNIPTGYVTELVKEEIKEIKHWLLIEHAHLYICGRFKGFGEDTIKILIEALGQNVFDEYKQAGQIHIDLY